VEVTDARLVLEIGGPRARDLLAVGTSLDLDEAAFPPGRAARTRFGRVTALIHLAGPEPVFRLHLDRPLERWFRTWLEGALRGVDAWQAGDGRLEVRAGGDAARP
jgi:sarcosine oxidase subunit gamma